jgi:hypothetical protein
MDRDLLEAGARHARWLYHQMRARWELTHFGDVTPVGDRWDVPGGKNTSSMYSHWERIALFCYQHDVALEPMLRANFAAAQQRPPYPNQLAGQHALEVYQRHPHDRDRAQLRGLWTSQVALAGLLTHEARQAGVAEPIREVICRQDAALSGFFRYCLAAGAGLTDLMRRLAPAAAAEYAMDRDLYDEVCGPLVPTSLVAELHRYVHTGEVSQPVGALPRPTYVEGSKQGGRHA